METPEIFPRTFTTWPTIVYSDKHPNGRRYVSTDQTCKSCAANDVWSHRQANSKEELLCLRCGIESSSGYQHRILSYENDYGPLIIQFQILQDNPFFRRD